LSDLVADNWIAMDDALDLVDNLMFKNPRWRGFVIRVLTIAAITWPQ